MGQQSILLSAVFNSGIEATVNLIVSWQDSGRILHNFLQMLLQNIFNDGLFSTPAQRNYEVKGGKGTDRPINTLSHCGF